MKKEIKFSSLEFDTIGDNGLIKEEFRWDDCEKTLTHFIDNKIFETFNEKDARKKLKTLIGRQKNKLTKAQENKSINITDNKNQLYLF